MKVTRDACLLGGWAEVSACQQLLDIGCGTGLLSLMCAQRSHARITALELDSDAALQALDNIQASPWAERIEVIQCSLQTWLQQSLHGTFDGIICNPPFFIDSLRCPDSARNQARHTDQLDYTTLIQAIDLLLSEQGRAWLLLPSQNIDHFTALLPASLILRETVLLAHSDQHSPKRCLLSLTRLPGFRQRSTLAIFDHTGEYSPQAKAILAPYYLRFARSTGKKNRSTSNTDIKDS